MRRGDLERGTRPRRVLAEEEAERPALEQPVRLTRATRRLQLVGEVEHGIELGRGRAVAGRQEDCVVPGDAARGLGERRVVEGDRDRIGACRRRPQHDEAGRRLDSDDPPPQRRRQLAQPVEVGRPRMGVDEPAALAAYLHEAKLGDVTRDGGLNGIETLVAERVHDVTLGRELALRDEPEDRALPLELVHISTSSSSSRPASTSSPLIVNGGVSRRTVSPAEPTSNPAASAAATTGAAGRSSSAPSMSPQPRTPTTPGSAASPLASLSPLARTDPSSSSSSVSTTATAAAHETGLPPKVLPWSPGSKPSGASSRTSSAPIGRPLARPFASVTACGATSSCS